MAVPYIFAASTSAIPLANLDSNFAYFANAITVSSGNVGIGTSSPNLSSSSTALTVNTGTAANYSAFELASGGTLNYHINANNSAVYHVAAGTRPWVVYTNGSERMRIDSSGNVGIGTSSPSAKLSVSDGTTRIDLSPFGGTGYVGTQTNHAVGFITNNTERARIDTSGNLLVGTTSGGAQTTITSTSAKNVMNLRNYDDVGRGIALLSSSANTVGSITWNASTTVYATSSDYRLKENIAPMTGALARVSTLKPVTYTWKADGSDGEGFIAHELAEVCPQAVVGEKDAVDAEGNPVYQGIDTSFLVATLTAAIQEQQALINELRARVAALESQP